MNPQSPISSPSWCERLGERCSRSHADLAHEAPSRGRSAPGNSGVYCCCAHAYHILMITQAAALQFPDPTYRQLTSSKVEVRSSLDLAYQMKKQLLQCVQVPLSQEADTSRCVRRERHLTGQGSQIKQSFQMKKSGTCRGMSCCCMLPSIQRRTLPPTDDPPASLRGGHTIASAKTGKQHRGRMQTGGTMMSAWEGGPRDARLSPVRQLTWHHPTITHLRRRLPRDGIGCSEDVQSRHLTRPRRGCMQRLCLICHDLCMQPPCLIWGILWRMVYTGAGIAGQTSTGRSRRHSGRLPLRPDHLPPPLDQW